MSRLPRRIALNRRKILQAIPFVAASISAPRIFAQGQTDAQTLVVLFTRTGNTRVVADFVRREQQADFFEIVPRDAYPANYEQTVARARRERDSGKRPPLANSLADIKRYETIYLAFPIWGMSTPAPVRSFLAAHDIGRQRVIPLITHGGYGTGNSLDVLAKHLPDAEVAEPFVMEGEQEKRVINRARNWLGTTA